MRFIHDRQQLNIGAAITRGKTTPWAPSDSHRARVYKLADEPRDLSPAAPGHLSNILPHDAFPALRQPVVLLIKQNPLRPLVDLALVPGGEFDLLTALQKRPDLLQAQSLSVAHTD
jgi:hypothetical protein